MDASIISIGTELTRGELVDTNSAFLAERLTLLGCRVVGKSTVPDVESAIVGVLDAAARRCRVVVATGGLGPTDDDLTTRAAAKLVNRPLVRHDEIVSALRERWTSRGREMPPSNVRQAEFPGDADVLENLRGTAPGFSISHGEATLFFFPGVPHEMKPMFEQHVAPWIAERVDATSAQIHLRTFGLPESTVGERLTDLASPTVELAYRASFPEIEVKVLGHGADHDEALTRASAVAVEARERLGDVVYGGKTARFGAVVAAALGEFGRSFAVLDDFSGGKVSDLLRSHDARADELFAADLSLFDDRLKARVLGSSAGGAAELAVDARRFAGTELGLAIHGREIERDGAVHAEFAVAIDGATPKPRVAEVAWPGGGWRARTLAGYAAARLLWLTIRAG